MVRASEGAADIVVIGGGVVGRASALRLAQAGFRTMLLDAPGERPPASYGNAGHIAVEEAQPLASPAVLRSFHRRLFAFGGALDFRLRDIAAWGPWAVRFVASCRRSTFEQGCLSLGALLNEALPAWRRLAADVGRPDLVIERGHIVAWDRASTAAAGRQAWAETDTGRASLRQLTESELAELRDRFGVAGAIGFDNTGQVAGPGKVLDALGTELDRLGVDRRVARVSRLELNGGRAEIVLEDGSRLRPDQILVAAGVGSGALMRSLGHVAPVVAERGYHIEGDGGEAWGDLPPIAFEDRSMIVVRFGRRLRATSFVEFASPSSSPDPRKWSRLDAHAKALRLPMTGPLSRWMGCRPTLPDYVPAIGKSGIAENVLYAFGHQHLGLTLAPITSELVGDVAAGATPSIDLAPYSLDRFQKPSRA